MRNILLGLTILFFTVSCENVNENENKLVTTFEVKYTIGSSWVDYDYTATIESDGSLFVTEKWGLDDYYRESSYDITVQEIDLIREKLGNLTDETLNATYGFGEDRPYDLPVTIISYRTSFNSDTTCIYFPSENELPKDLEVFLSTISQIVQSHDTLDN